MNDEQRDYELSAIHDALIEATLQAHTASQRVMGVWPLKDAGYEQDGRPYVYQSLFEQEIVPGTFPPKFTVLYETCENGCHHRAYIVDEANDYRYFVSEMPRIVIGGLEINQAEIHPAVVMAEVRKLQSVLN